MAILGFSGSPIKNSNTDRLVKHFLESSGEEFEFIKLSDYNIKPCRACLACVKTNTCILKDDFAPIEAKIKQADAFVFGFYVPFSMIDAFTKSLLERLYSMHHNILLQGKYMVSIGSSVAPTSPTMDAIHETIAMEGLLERMNYLGKISIQGSLPCAVCGQGEECPHGFLKMVYGPDAKEGTHHCIPVEKQMAWQEAETMAKKLGNFIKGKEEYTPNEFVQAIMAKRGR